LILRGYPGVKAVKFMFKRLKFVNKRSLNNLRCYATPFVDRESEASSDFNNTQNNSLILHNINNFQRPLDQSYNSLESKYHLKNIVNQHKETFINELAGNPWNYDFYHSRYIISDTGAEKILLKYTQTRIPTEILKLCNDAFNSENLAVGVNLSSNPSLGHTLVNFVIIDIDPPNDMKYHPLEGQLLKLIIDYYMNEHPENELENPKSISSNASNSIRNSMTLPFIVKTPRGLHLMFRGDRNGNNKYNYLIFIKY